LIAVYPTNRLSFVWAKAPKAPNIIDPAATNKKRGCQKKRKTFVPNKKNKTREKKAKIPSLTIVAKKKVTGVKTPSYTSGVQAWHGKIESLNQKPKKIKISAKDNNNGNLSISLKRNLNSEKSRVFVIIKVNAIPNNKNPEDSAPRQKYFIPASSEF
jgi:hypothetical protein